MEHPSRVSPGVSGRSPASFAPILVLSAQPWDWIAPLFRAIQQWLNSDSIKELPANAGLFLITGGLSILTLIVSLVFLQSILPVRGGSPLAAQNLPAERELRPLRAPGQGRAVPMISPARKPALNFH